MRIRSNRSRRPMLPLSLIRASAKTIESTFPILEHLPQNLVEVGFEASVKLAVFNPRTIRASDKELSEEGADVYRGLVGVFEALNRSVTPEVFFDFFRQHWSGGTNSLPDVGGLPVRVLALVKGDLGLALHLEGPAGSKLSEQTLVDHLICPEPCYSVIFTDGIPAAELSIAVSRASRVYCFFDYGLVIGKSKIVPAQNRVKFITVLESGPSTSRA